MGVTQRELLEHLQAKGVQIRDRSAVPLSERGATLPATDVLPALAGVLGCTTDYRLLRSDDPYGCGPAAMLSPGWAEVVKDAQARGITVEEIRAVMDLLERLRETRGS